MAARKKIDRQYLVQLPKEINEKIIQTLSVNSYIHKSIIVFLNEIIFLACLIFVHFYCGCVFAVTAYIQEINFNSEFPFSFSQTETLRISFCHMLCSNDNRKPSCFKDVLLP